MDTVVFKQAVKHGGQVRHPCVQSGALQSGVELASSMFPWQVCGSQQSSTSACERGMKRRKFSEFGSMVQEARAMAAAWNVPCIERYGERRGV